MPIDKYKHRVGLEDELMRKHGGAVILGAYTEACVKAIAANLASRHVGKFVAIDYSLSIDNGLNCDAPGSELLHAATLESILAK